MPVTTPDPLDHPAHGPLDHPAHDRPAPDRPALDHPALDRPAPARPDEPHDLTEVRAWARSRGYPVDESAAVPLQVLRTYRRVHAL